MGIFSKIWKGIKKTFKKIGKGIKKVFQKVGKFMGKIGIVGQIAMHFLLPGIGGVLAKTFGKAIGALSKLGPIGKAAGWVLGKAGEFAKMAYKGYKTVTGAVTDFIGTTGKYVGGKLGIPGMDNMTLEQAFGKEGFAGRMTERFAEFGDAAGEFLDTDIKGVLPKTEINLDASLTAEKSQFVPEDMLGEKTEFSLEEMLKGPQLSPEQAKDLITVTDTSIPKVTDKLQPFSILEKPTTSAATVETAAASADKGWLETLTGEKTFGDVGKKFASETMEYAYAAPGKAISSAVTTAGLQGLGLAAKPPGEPGPAWGGYASQYASQTYAATQQAMQPIQPVSYGDYVQSYAMGGEQQGSYIGPDFWQSYLQRSLAA